MAGRNIQPVRFRFSGDIDACKTLVGYGQKLLGMVTEQMGFQKLSQNTLTKTLEGGIVVVASSVFGVQTIQIHVPPIGGVQPKKKRIIVEQKPMTQRTDIPVVDVVYSAGNVNFPFNFNPTLFGGSLTSITDDWSSPTTPMDWLLSSGLLDTPNINILGRGWFGVDTSSVTENYQYHTYYEEIDYSAIPAWKYIPHETAIDPAYINLHGISMFNTDIPDSLSGVGDTAMTSHCELHWNDYGSTRSYYACYTAAKNMLDMLRNIPWTFGHERVLLWLTRDYFECWTGGSNFYIGAQAWDDKHPDFYYGLTYLDMVGIDGTIQAIVDEIKAMNVRIVPIPLPTDSQIGIPYSGSHGLGFEDMVDIGTATGGIEPYKFVTTGYSGEYGGGVSIAWRYIQAADDLLTQFEGLVSAARSPKIVRTNPLPTVTEVDDI